MKILITGEDGYIAKSLYESLKDKYNITTIGRKNFDLTNYKLLDSYLKNTYFDVVIHCAVTGGSRLKTDTFGDMDNNLKMYYNLLNCNDRFGKLIHFGSGAEIHSPESPYGLSKRVIAKSIYEIDNFYNIRIYAVFDENELDTRFIKSNIKRYINKEPMLVQNKKMSFFYIKDLVTLVNHYIQSSPSSLLKESNCAYVDSTSLLDIANIINKLGDYEVPIYIDTTISEDYESKFNAPYKLKYIGLTQGIIETYNKLKNEY